MPGTSRISRPVQSLSFQNILGFHESHVLPSTHTACRIQGGAEARRENGSAILLVGLPAAGAAWVSDLSSYTLMLGLSPPWGERQVAREKEILVTPQAMAQHLLHPTALAHCPKPPHLSCWGARASHLASRKVAGPLVSEAGLGAAWSDVGAQRLCPVCWGNCPQCGRSMCSDVANTWHEACSGGRPGQARAVEGCGKACRSTTLSSPPRLGAGPTWRTGPRCLRHLLGKPAGWTLSLYQGP